MKRLNDFLKENRKTIDKIEFVGLGVFGVSLMVYGISQQLKGDFFIGLQPFFMGVLTTNFCTAYFTGNKSKYS